MLSAAWPFLLSAVVGIGVVARWNWLQEQKDADLSDQPEEVSPM